MRDEKNERTRVTRRSGTRMGGAPADRDAGRYDELRRRENAARDAERGNDDEHRTFERHRDESSPTREHREPEQERRDGGRERPAAEEGARPARREAQPHARKRRNADRTIHQLIPYVMLCLAPFAIVSFVLRDLVKIEGAAGDFGSFLADFLCGLFGVVGYAVPFFMLLLALRWRRFVSLGILGRRLLLSSSFLLLSSGIIHVFLDGKGNRNVLDTAPASLYNSGVTCGSGGFFGGFIGEWLGKVLGLPGTIILAIPLLVLIGIYLVGLTPQGLWERLSYKARMRRANREPAPKKQDAKPQQPPARAAVERSDTAQAKEDPVRADWRQPRPIAGLSDPEPLYVFCEEEDEPIPAPHAARHRKGTERIDIPDDEPEEAIYAAAPTPAEPTPPAEPDPISVLRAAAAEQSVPPFATPDIPADPQPISVPPAAKQQPPSVSPLFSPAREPVPPAQQLVPPVSKPISPASQPAPPVEQPDAKDEDYLFAPFALPVRNFPKKEQPVSTASHTVAQPPTVREAPVQAASPTPSPTIRGAEIGEEILGADISRRQPSTPQRPIFAAAPTVQPAAPQPASASAADAPFTFSRPAPTAERPIPPSPVVASPTPVRDPVDTTPRGKIVTSFADLADDPVVEEFEEEPPVENPFGFAREPKPAAEKPVENPFGFAREPKPAEEKPVENPFGFAREPKVAEEKPVESPFGFAREPKPAEEKPVENPFAFSREPVANHAPVPPARPVAPQPAARPMAPRPAARAQRVEPDPVPEQPPVVIEYQRPPLSLLNEDQNVRTDDFYEEIEETKETLRQTMASFNIRIQEEINYSHGPSVTRYEMRPVAGTSVRSVTNRTEDIALNLASSVRIEAPIPGKPAIGIEVPNKVRETVYMRTMLESDLFQNSKEPLEVPLGLDVGGAVRMCNLAKMPHLLVAGTTGSGKSVCINSILVSLIYKTSPQDLRLILIDPKQIEFAPYEHVPHLYMPIVTDMQRAAGALACAVQEMERRFSLIKDVGVRNIEAYNEAVKNDPEREHLPYIIIVIDEFADLKMSCNNNDPENFTCRIAQKARAAGIHLIIGTQRPSVDVITGKLKTNIPSRIAFMVKQQVDSRTILDANGAESLTGRGDMLYMPTNSNDKQPVRIQGAFVSDSELDRIVSYVKAHNAPVQYNKSFMDQIEAEMARAAKSDRKGEDFDYDDGDESGEDPKFLEAVELAVQTQKVATSLLQRRLGVGYGRAAKIIDRMEELGLVSAPEGNKPRKLLPAAQGYLDHMAGGGDEDFEGDYVEDYNQ